jgi:hypothetical protein
VHEPAAALRSVAETESMLSALSIGVASHVHRVVLPPEIVPANGEDEARLRKGLSILRTSSRRLVELFGEVSAIAGLPSWTVSGSEGAASADQYALPAQRACGDGHGEPRAQGGQTRGDDRAETSPCWATQRLDSVLAAAFHRGPSERYRARG